MALVACTKMHDREAVNFLDGAVTKKPLGICLFTRNLLVVMKVTKYGFTVTVNWSNL